MRMKNWGLLNGTKEKREQIEREKERESIHGAVREKGEEFIG